MGDKFRETRDMARDMLRGSIIEDAAAQFLAQIVEHIHESRIVPLKTALEAKDAEIARLREAAKTLDKALYEKEAGRNLGAYLHLAVATARAALAEDDTPGEKEEE
jgi:hypothetical protein